LIDLQIINVENKLSSKDFDIVHTTGPEESMEFFINCIVTTIEGKYKK
jgi:hypothetical protein